jgi:DNA-binding response OmpR family regulator
VVDVVLGLIERGDVRFAGDGLRVSCDAAAPTPGHERSVLLVEDDEVDARQTLESIEHAVHDVRVVRARDIRSATELCRSSRWALAVVDDTLPDGDGLEFLRAVKERTPGLPVLMLTSEGAEATAIEAFRRGASDYVVKSNGFAAEVGDRVRAFLEAAA